MSLPFCAPPQPVVPALKACGGVDSSNAARLCTAVTTILEKASCEELASQEYLVHLIEKVGLSGDLRKERLYGQSLKYMRRIGSHSGLWQDPQQIAGALLNLGLHARRAPPPTPFSYVEVGVFTAWSCCIISAYLRRTGGGAPFSGLAVDVKAANIASSTMEMLTRLNVTFMGRSTFDRKMRAGERLLTGGAGTLPGSAGSSSKRPQFDLCFIDGARPRARALAAVWPPPCTSRPHGARCRVYLWLSRACVCARMRLLLVACHCLQPSRRPLVLCRSLRLRPASTPLRLSDVP